MFRTGDLDLVPASKRRRYGKKTFQEEQEVEVEQVDLDHLVKKHHRMSLNVIERLMLLCFQPISCCVCRCCSTRTKMLRMQTQGNRRMARELDITKMARDLRFVKMVVKAKFMDAELNFLTTHNGKTVINLDSEDQSEFEYFVDGQAKQLAKRRPVYASDGSRPSEQKQ